VISARPELLNRVHASVAGLTMVPRTALDFTWIQALRFAQSEIRGSFVECGTWRGGCAFGMALVQADLSNEERRKVWMFDSFQGLPPATERDGPLAIEYQKDIWSPTYFDNCRAEYVDTAVEALRRGLGMNSCRIVPGWFEETIPVYLETLDKEGIAVLRIDADWYDPVHYVLEHLGPLVSGGGLIIVDDYYTWDGSARAVHDYLSRHDLPWRIKGLSDFTSAYMIKAEGRTTREL
jgi:O-methyltransferase